MSSLVEERSTGSRVGRSSAIVIASSISRSSSITRSMRPSSYACSASSILFWRMGFVTISVTAASGPISRGASCVAPQAGTMPSRHSGDATCWTSSAITR
jgi:hypothetical protein